MRILYIASTQVPPPLDPRADRFHHISQVVEGDVLQPIWFDTPEEVEARYGPGSYPVYTSGKFRYHWFLAGSKYPRGRLPQFRFYLSQGRKIFREMRFDCIVAYSHMTTGVMGAAVKLFTGAKLIIEIVVAPHLAYIAETPKITLKNRLMRIYSDVCLHLSLWAADRVQLYYPSQLAPYPLLRNFKASVFPDFVAVSMIPARQKSEERFIVMVGDPWFRKGADRLIEAFKGLAADFPDVKLKLVGWFRVSDREQLEALAGGLEQIELVRAMPNPQTLEIVSRCQVMVLPSRAEGVPRSLIEAMAVGVPVIGSDSSGIPYIVRDGENGFVIPEGDPKGIEKRLRELLSDCELRDRMGAKGYQFAHNHLSEQSYVQNYAAMIEAAVRDRA